jgi:MFS family permease
MQENFGKLLILSLGFLLLFNVFNTAQNLASQVLDDLGFGDLGFYSLGVLYFAFSLSCFVATPIVNKCGERISMTVGALCYTLYTASFMLASAPLQYPDTDIWILKKGVIEAVIIVTAISNGFGASILWVAQGRYISRIANDTNKGSFNSIFWACLQSSQVVGPLFAALVLQNTNSFTFYCIMSSICFFASLFFLLL